MRLENLLITAIALNVFTSSAFTHAAALEEVFVTATRQSKSLQDIPVTVTAFNSETIQEARIENATDVAIMTPSLTVNVNTSPFNARLSIRGIGTAQNDIALEPSVGFFVDGVFMGRTGLGMSDLIDVERIEVLQGPQGTLYGKNTNAGAISVITRDPNMEEYDGFIETSLGNYDLQNLKGSVSGPISDTVAFRLAGNVTERDGYYDNNGGNDMNQADDWNLRGKLLWEPLDSLTVLLNASHVERDARCCAADSIQNASVNTELANQGLQQDKNDAYDYEVAVDVESKFDLDSDMASLTVSYDEDWGSIASITAWNDYDYETNTDADRSQLDILGLRDNEYSGDSLSQDLQFSSTFGGEVDYQLGLFYYEQTATQGGGKLFAYLGDDFLTIASQQPLDLPVPVEFAAQPGDTLTLDHKLDTETFAIFGQATWHVTDRWHVKGGLRWTDEEKKADLFSVTDSTAPTASLGGSLLDGISTPIDASLKRSSDNVDWLVSISRDVGDDIMIFATVATGSKSGGFNTVSGTEDQREFDDEDTTNYELGIKSTLLDARLRVNATAFYTEIDDYQSQQQLESGVGTFVSNFGSVESSGIDAFVEAVPLPNLTVTAGLLYMHDYEVTDGVDDGLDLAFTAEYNVNLSATLVLPVADGSAYGRADYMWMDDHTTNTASEDQLRPADFDDRNLLNLKLGWRNDNWDLSLWGKNLTDDDYASRTTIPFPFSGAEVYFLAAPRTYGATARYNF